MEHGPVKHNVAPHDGAKPRGEPIDMVVVKNPVRDLEAGEHCLLRVMNRHFWVRVETVYDTGLRTTFPGTDYPVPGMKVELEIHEESGYTAFVTEVLAGPFETGGGLLLKTPDEGVFHQHRGSIRVSTDLTVQVRDQVHVRHYSAAMVNLSGGGALLRTIAPLELGTTVEVAISLPGEQRSMVLGVVRHVHSAPGSQPGERMIGVNFLPLDPAPARSIARFIYQRLVELAPNS